MHVTHQSQTAADVSITRCPECRIAFRVTRKHLEAAQGSVRCGSCLHIFRADRHMLHIQHPDNPRPDSQPSATTEQQRETIDHLDSFTNGSHHTDIETAAEQNDEAASRALLEALESEASRPEATTGNDKRPGEIPVAPVNGHDQTSTQNAFIPSSPANTRPIQELDLDHDPLNLHYQRVGLRQRAATLTCLAMVGALVVQAVIYNLGTLTQNANIRPLLTGICSLTGCHIPKQQDHSRISVRSIVARNHPAYQNILTIDAIITNEADFPQAYPDLLLVISDRDSKVIGSRILPPDRYLSGEASGDTDMQPMQPVHLSLSILNPGPEAHNITFKAP